MKRHLETALISLMTMLGLYLSWVAATLTIDMYDTFEIFLNSKLISGDPSGFYFPTRAYIFPTLLAPIFFVARHVSSDPAVFALTLSHVFSLLISCTLVWATYRLFRVHLDRLQSLLGAALFFLNPLIIHSAPISKEDQPGALFTVAAMYFYLRLTKTGKTKHLALASVFTFLVMGTRYNLVPLLPAVFAAHQLFLYDFRPPLRELARKGLALAVLPAIVWLLAPTLLYAWIGRAGLFHAPALFLHELYGATVGAVGASTPMPEYPAEVLGFLVRSFTPPLLLLAVAGMALGWRKRVPGGLFHGLWLGIFLVFHTFALGHKESRYLFPFFAPLYFFVVVGATGLLARLPALKFRALATAAILAWPLYLAVAECVKFQEPFYRDNFVKRVSDRAAELSLDGSVAWLGPFYAIHPRDYIFDRQDVVTYLYHVYVHQIRYYTGLNMHAHTQAFTAFIPGGRLENGVFPPPTEIFGVHDGEAVVVNVEPSSYVTDTVPEQLKPLVVERARTTNFTAKAGDTRKVLELTSTVLPKAAFTVETRADEFVVRSRGLDDQSWLVFAQFTNGARGAIGFVGREAPTPELHINRANAGPGAALRELLVVTFDSVSEFAAP